MNWIWNAVNTLLIFMIFIMIEINKDIKSDTTDRISKLEYQLEVLENRKDSVVVNNTISFPKSINVIYQ